MSETVMTGVYLSNHPVILDKMALLREKNTPPREFRRLLHEISLLLGYEAMRDLPGIKRTIETPLTVTEAEVLAVKPLFVPILRAGIGMVEAMLQLVPDGGVGHIGLYRDHDTLLPVEYYVKLPKDLRGMHAFMLDPMLATGGSAAYTAEILMERGVDQITMISLVSAPPGINRLKVSCPEVRIFTAALDPELNDRGYIVPGLGDAGDRLYGTEGWS